MINVPISLYLNVSMVHLPHLMPGRQLMEQEILLVLVGMKTFIDIS